VSQVIFAANGDNLVLGRGALMLDRYVNNAPSGSLRFVGNVTELRLSTTDEVREKFSAVEESAPLLKRVVSRRTIEVVGVFDEFEMENLALAMMGNVAEATQSAVAVTDMAIANVQHGRYYDLGSRNIAALVVTTDPAGTTYTLGTDYTADLIRGLLYIVPGGTIPDGTGDLLVDFTRATVTTIQTIDGGNESLIEAFLHFESDNASGPNYRLRAWRVSINPDGELGFIGDDFGNFSLRMAVQSDGVNHPTTPNYVLERYDPLAV